MIITALLSTLSADNHHHLRSDHSYLSSELQSQNSLVTGRVTHDGHLAPMQTSQLETRRGWNLEAVMTGIHMNVVVRRR